jgi:ferritin-like metal-binding protein YciE
MKIKIDGIDIFDIRYEHWEDIIDDYTRAEGQKGRTVPQFAAEVLLSVIALWILEKAAERALDWLLELKSRRQDEHYKTEITEHLERLIEHLERLDAQIQSLHMQTISNREIISKMFQEAQLPITVTAETEAERDLTRAVAEKLGKKLD